MSLPFIFLFLIDLWLNFLIDLSERAGLIRGWFCERNERSGRMRKKRKKCHQYDRKRGGKKRKLCENLNENAKKNIFSHNFCIFAKFSIFVWFSIFRLTFVSFHFFCERFAKIKISFATLSSKQKKNKILSQMRKWFCKNFAKMRNAKKKRKSIFGLSQKMSSIRKGPKTLSQKVSKWHRNERALSQKMRNVIETKEHFRSLSSKRNFRFDDGQTKIFCERSWNARAYEMLLNLWLVFFYYWLYLYWL